MLLANRTLLRLNRAQPQRLTMMASRARFSAAATDEYHSLDDALLHELQNPVAFQGDTAPVFDSTDITERRFVPYEIKTLSFKCAGGIAGVWVWDYMYHFGFYSEIFAGAFALNWMYKATMMMSSTIRKVELHRD